MHPARDRLVRPRAEVHLDVAVGDLCVLHLFQGFSAGIVSGRLDQDQVLAEAEAEVLCWRPSGPVSTPRSAKMALEMQVTFSTATGSPSASRTSPKKRKPGKEPDLDVPGAGVAVGVGFGVLQVPREEGGEALLQARHVEVAAGIRRGRLPSDFVPADIHRPFIDAP